VEGIVEPFIRFFVLTACDNTATILRLDAYNNSHTFKGQNKLLEDLKENGKPQLFPGKIGVVTTVASVNEDDYYSTERLLKKYGPEKIIHVTWPENFIVKQEQMFDTLVNLAKDSEIKAIIINQAVEGSNAAVDKLKETRNDIFIVYCNTNEDIVACAARANLVLMLDRTGMGQPMVNAGKKTRCKDIYLLFIPKAHVLSESVCPTRHDSQNLRRRRYPLCACYSP